MLKSLHTNWMRRVGEKEHKTNLIFGISWETETCHFCNEYSNCLLYSCLNVTYIWHISEVNWHINNLCLPQTMLSFYGIACWKSTELSRSVIYNCAIGLIFNSWTISFTVQKVQQFVCILWQFLVAFQVHLLSWWLLSFFKNRKLQNCCCFKIGSL